MALYLRPGSDTLPVVDALKRSMADTPLVIRSNRELREQVMRIFDQTFAVTRLLHLMSLLVAACGVEEADLPEKAPPRNPPQRRVQGTGYEVENEQDRRPTA